MQDKYSLRCSSTRSALWLPHVHWLHSNTLTHTRMHRPTGTDTQLRYSPCTRVPISPLITKNGPGQVTENKSILLKEIFKCDLENRAWEATVALIFLFFFFYFGTRWFTLGRLFSVFIMIFIFALCQTVHKYLLQRWSISAGEWILNMEVSVCIIQYPSKGAAQCLHQKGHMNIRIFVRGRVDIVRRRGC